MSWTGGPSATISRPPSSANSESSQRSLASIYVYKPALPQSPAFRWPSRRCSTLVVCKAEYHRRPPSPIGIHSSSFHPPSHRIRIHNIVTIAPPFRVVFLDTPFFDCGKRHAVACHTRLTITRSLLLFICFEVRFSCSFLGRPYYTVKSSHYRRLGFPLPVLAS